MTKRNEEQRQARVEELKKFNRVLNTLQSRLVALFGKVEGEKVARLAEMTFTGKLEKGCFEIDVVFDYYLYNFQTDRKPREMSEETKQRNFEKQLAKLKEKYGIKG